MPRRIVLIGATGFFGRRLVARLARLSDIELFLTSRSEERARRLAREIRDAVPGAKLGAMPFERDAPGSIERLKDVSPWLVIDASGPFQTASYDLARAALGFGAHWIDLADASRYILGFEAALDGFAREKGLVARAGASSTPALSIAAVEALTHGWQRLESVEIAIMPGGAGKVGEAVIGAVLSYAGAPIPIFTDGRHSYVTGWGNLKRVKIEGLGVRYLSPVDTADALLLPEHAGVTSRVSFYAGLESRLEQFGIVFLATLRRYGFAASLTSLAPLLERARNLTALLASDRGAMTVDCVGLDAGGRRTFARWRLIAEKGEGPNVPVLPALALTRLLLADDVMPGAGPAIGVLSLDAIEREMSSPALKISRHAMKAAEHGDMPNAGRRRSSIIAWHMRALISSAG